MATTPNLSEEQVFLTTLQECLQADNDKRSAAEVRLLSRVFQKLVTSDSSRLSIKRSPMNGKPFCWCRPCAMRRSVDRSANEQRSLSTRRLSFSLGLDPFVCCGDASTIVSNPVRSLLAEVFPRAANGVEKGITRAHQSTRRRWNHPKEDLFHRRRTCEKSHG